MKATVEEKLDKIADVWNYFIWDYKWCSNKIKFNEDVKTNYFGDILGYFQDTIDIVFTDKTHSNFTDKFSFTISFLQAIYIQQDFIQELLEIFKINVNKGDLKNDPRYSINRELRNELVGHPIRKFEGSLTSSTLFSYEGGEGEIQYLRYHKDNNFKFESKTFKIADIQERHREFLEKYFDIILLKLKSILNEYLLELEKLENVIEKHDFKTVLKLVEIYFEAIFTSDYVYDKMSLSKIYDRRKEHKRYQNYIDRFYSDLRVALTDKRKSVNNIFEKRAVSKFSLEDVALPKINIVFTNSGNIAELSKSRKETYHYELGKIANKRNLRDFDFFGGILKSRCKDKKTVLEELEHMQKNIYDEIEYYTALRLIYLELNEE